MKYNFDTILNRYNTNSLKYDYAAQYRKPENALPMWVADMDFSSPPEVLEDINAAVSHGIFGYSKPGNDYYDAVADWFDKRFAYRPEQQEIVETPSVIFAMAQAIRAFTAPGESVLIQTPVYTHFFDIVRNNNRKLVTNSLICHNNRYTIDFEDFERKILAEKVKLFLLCNPHNPVGRVWTKQELSQLSNICRQHNVLIISDEVHCDFIRPGHKHICFGNIDENAIIATSPGKSFNLAGLQVSNLFIKNNDLRFKLKAEFTKTGHVLINTLGLVACRSAYEKGKAWLDALNAYIDGNIRLAGDFLASELPQVSLIRPEGTYLLWLDFGNFKLTQAVLNHRLTQQAMLWWECGTKYGKEGKGFQRVNIACPGSVLEDALSRLKKAFG